MIPYHINEAKENVVPIIVSVPHCGTLIPDDLRNQFFPNQLDTLDDTDWYVDKLYDFVPSMGITMISATYSRWVIDLNREIDDRPLYQDGRIITGVCPVANFKGEKLYVNKRRAVDKKEIQRRYTLYYRPYHEKLQQLLKERLASFGRVLLWDCHSIRQHVPTIHPLKFPDLILGDANERSASSVLINDALQVLGSKSWAVSHNYPFKGGTITRTYGKPHLGQHALQLEMTKVNYMDDDERVFDETRAEKMRQLLRSVFEKLIDRMSDETTSL
jgi:N-formylglutamate deformylase